MNCKTVPVGAKGKLNSWNGCAVVAIGGTAKCCQMYGWCKCIQSQRMLMTCMGFVWTGWPPSLHGPALLLVPTVFPPVGLPYPSEAHCTIPTFALVFGGNKKKKTKHEKRRRRFLHDGVLARGSKVSSVTPPRRQFLVPVLTTVQE